MMTLSQISFFTGCTKNDNKVDLTNAGQIASELARDQNFRDFVSETSLFFDLLGTEPVLSNKTLDYTLLNEKIKFVKSNRDFEHFFSEIGIRNASGFAKHFISAEENFKRINARLEIKNADPKILQHALELAVDKLNKIQEQLPGHGTEPGFIEDPCAKCKKRLSSDLSDCKLTLIVASGLCLVSIEIPPAYVACVLAATIQSDMCKSTSQRHYKECIEDCTGSAQ